MHADWRNLWLCVPVVFAAQRQLRLRTVNASERGCSPS